jgi:hypothetical protein
VHPTEELGKSLRFDDISDVNFLGESFAGIYELLVFGVTLETAAAVSHPELMTSASAEREILSGLDGRDNLLSVASYKCGVAFILYLVELARHCNIFRALSQIVVNHLQDTENQNIDTADSA